MAGTADLGRKGIVACKQRKERREDRTTSKLFIIICVVMKMSNLREAVRMLDAVAGEYIKTAYVRNPLVKDKRREGEICGGGEP